jgi:hypothetical protein
MVKHICHGDETVSFVCADFKAEDTGNDRQTGPFEGQHMVFSLEFRNMCADIVVLVLDRYLIREEMLLSFS